MFEGFLKFLGLLLRDLIGEETLVKPTKANPLNQDLASTGI